MPVDHLEPGEQGEAQAEQGEGEQLRDKLRRRFDEWLTEALSEPAMPEGIAVELLAEPSDESVEPFGANDCDLYKLWAAMIALTQEVKLQGRFFKQLSDALAQGAMAQRLEELAGLRGAFGELHELAARALANKQQQDLAGQQQAEEPQREAVLLLVDLRERLLRGLNSAVQCRMRLEQLLKPGWFRRSLVGKERDKQLLDTVRAQEKGYQLSLARLDEGLEQLGLREVPALGAPFDPKLMTVIAVEDSDNGADNTVSEVYRRGYIWRDQLLCTAQVKVTRRPAGPARVMLSATS